MLHLRGQVYRYGHPITALLPVWAGYDWPDSWNDVGEAVHSEAVFAFKTNAGELAVAKRAGRQRVPLSEQEFDS
jgi:hypothetical protein